MWCSEKLIKKRDLQGYNTTTGESLAIVTKTNFKILHPLRKRNIGIKSRYHLLMTLLHRCHTESPPDLALEGCKK